LLFMRNTLRKTHLNLQCTILGLGIFVFLCSLLRGNLLILSGPLALWFYVVSLPDNRVTKHVVRRQKRRRKKHLPTSKSTSLTGRITVVIVIWLVAVGCIWIRIAKGPVNETEISIAMKHATDLFQEGHYSEALAEFSTIEIPSSFPGRLAQKYHNIGLIQLKLGDRSEAQKALQESISYDITNIDAYYLLAVIAYESKDYTKTAEWIEQADSQIAELPEKFRVLAAELQRNQNIIPDLRKGN
jgi:tetratricopeptide (TPR) repeat protein